MKNQVFLLASLILVTTGCAKSELHISNQTGRGIHVYSGQTKNITTVPAGATGIVPHSAGKIIIITQRDEIWEYENVETTSVEATKGYKVRLQVTLGQDGVMTLPSGRDLAFPSVFGGGTRPSAEPVAADNPGPDTAAEVQAASAQPDGVPKDWILLQAGNAFSFWGPADLKEKKVRGIDSFVGEYTSPKMHIGFDYGMYSYKYEGDKYELVEITVDGRKAVLAKWDGGVGLYVGSVDRNAKFPIMLSMDVTCKQENAKQAELLLRSIKFSEANRDGE